MQILWTWEVWMRSTDNNISFSLLAISISLMIMVMPAEFLVGCLGLALTWIFSIGHVWEAI